MARKALTGVSRSALTDLTTGTSVDSRANRENSLKSGCSMLFLRDVHYRGGQCFGLWALGFGLWALGFGPCGLRRWTLDVRLRLDQSLTADARWPESNFRHLLPLPKWLKSLLSRVL